jgi:hypothetical protein
MTQQSTVVVAERRTDRRIPVDQRCWCEGNEVTLFGRITNASTKGAFIRTTASLQIGERARLVWDTPNGERAVIRAEVVWVSDGGSGTEPGLGLRLIDFETGEEFWDELVHESGIATLEI